MRRQLTLFLVAAAACSVAYGGSVVGTVDFVQAGDGSTAEGVYALVRFNATPSGQPSCAIDPRFAFNPGTAQGKAFLALLLSAKAMGNTVQVFGTGACNIAGLPENERISDMRLL